MYPEGEYDATMSDTHAIPTLQVSSRLYDPVVLLVAGVLMTIGAAMVYSATVTVQGAPFSWREWWESPLKQTAFVLAGFLAMLVAAHVDYRMLAWNQPRDGWRVTLLVLIVCGLLVAVLVPGIGRSVLGARRAIYIPGIGFGFQPSELAKVVLVIWLAAFLSQGQRGAGFSGPAPGKLHVPGTRPRGRLAVPAELPRFGDPRYFFLGFLPAALSAGVIIGLTSIEDYGTAALMGVVMMVMLLVAGARVWHLGLMILPGAAAGALLVLIKPHRIQRIVTWLNEQPDPQREGYQINQAMMAIGSGGWWGRGLGAGVQKYGYLPQDNNDFILATICEELGVAGGIVIALLFVVLVWRGWRIARRAQDPFGRLLAVGLTITICLQAAFNIGVVTNSVPTKGISLPFVSAGGSGVVFLGLAAGLLAAVGREHAPTLEDD